MTDPILVLALAASALAAFSFILARVIPDEYDRANPRMRLQRAKHSGSRR
jgi:hypothetical protein